MFARCIPIDFFLIAKYVYKYCVCDFSRIFGSGSGFQSKPIIIMTDFVSGDEIWNEKCNKEGREERDGIGSRSQYFYSKTMVPAAAAALHPRSFPLTRLFSISEPKRFPLIFWLWLLEIRPNTSSSSLHRCSNSSPDQTPHTFFLAILYYYNALHIILYHIIFYMLSQCFGWWKGKAFELS